MIGRLLRRLRRLLLGAGTAERVHQTTTLTRRADELLDTYEAEMRIYDLRVSRMERKAHVHHNT